MATPAEQDPAPAANENESEPPALETFAIRAAATLGVDNFETDILPALRVLAESMQMVGESSVVQGWTTSDWLLGLTVLVYKRSAERKLAEAPASVSPPISSDEMRTLLRFVRISDAVYVDTPEEFIEAAKLPNVDVVKSFDGSVLAPKYLLLVDKDAKEIVLAIRGTASLLDFCTDVCLTNEPFRDGQGHRGMVQSTKWLIDNVRPDIEKLTKEHPNFKLVVTGHSLGAGVAALLSMELKPDFPGLVCIAFATPASVTESLATSCTEYVTTVVNGDDCVPRAHQKSLLELHSELSQFDWRTALQQMVDEQIEEHKAQADERFQEIRAAFDKIQKAQEKQTQEMLDDIKDSTFGRHVSASLELTKAAFWTDKPTSDRIASLKQIVAKHKETGEDKDLWTSVEASVARLEELANDAQRPQEAQAVLTKSKVLLASAGYDDEPEGEESDEFAAFRARIQSVIEQASEKLEKQVEETLKEVSEKVSAGLEDLKEDIEDLKEDVAEKIEETVEAIQAKLPKDTEQDEPPKPEDEAPKATPPPEQPKKPLPPQDPLFPPGRILHLNRVASDPGVELLLAGHTAFARLVLSTAMVLDHLCTNYEKVLKSAAGVQS